MHGYYTGLAYIFTSVIEMIFYSIMVMDLLLNVMVTMDSGYDFWQVHPDTSYTDFYKAKNIYSHFLIQYSTLSFSQNYLLALERDFFKLCPQSIIHYLIHKRG